jgi:hypothetical protein
VISVLCPIGYTATAYRHCRRAKLALSGTAAGREHIDPAWMLIVAVGYLMWYRHLIVSRKDRLLSDICIVNSDAYELSLDGLQLSDD